MNVFQKLQKCRVDLKAVKITESGNNKFAGYTYMELGDFLPHIVDLCDKYNLCTIVSFAKEEATLTIVDSDKPEALPIVFASPMSTAELKGCHAIQNLGAVETYLRRYLYVTAFDIVEHDALDSTQGKKDEPKPQRPAQQPPKPAPPADPALISDAQRKMIFAKMKAAGLEPETLKAAFKVESSSQIKKSQVEDVLAWIDGQAQS